MRVSITKSIRGSLCAGVLAGAVALTLAPAPAVAKQSVKTRITETEVKAAQEAWCEALVKIGKVYEERGAYRAVASQAIDNLYDYKEGKVFFKPTLAFGKNTFRPTKAGALSYFVGGNQDFPEDNPGFAVKTPWVRCVAVNNAAPNGIQIHGNIAITMGNVSLTSKDEKTTKVDKTFVFRRGGDGKLRLCVHHSSLPFAPGQ